jgi:para-aminobenzoate synthetase/4-amino-4-deoxychorismate lyase
VISCCESSGFGEHYGMSHPPVQHAAHGPPPSVTAGVAVLQRHAPDGRAGRWRFDHPRRVISAHRVGDVLPALCEVERLTDAGAYAAGFIAYEAAPAFDPALAVHPPLPMPLLWFGIYDRPEPFADTPAPGGIEPAAESDWRPTVSPAGYAARVGRIKDYIAAGDAYQVNYTFRLRAPRREIHPGGDALWIDTGDDLICSHSPELFFRRDGTRIVCRPMKGTAARGRTPREDAEQALGLKHSEKNRAENVMIVDMVRNDLGRIARPGSVRVESLYDVEKYDTLYQMTSTVAAETAASLTDVFGALFPCASVTGAPKVRAMQIIAELEPEPRGVYTGALGWIGPGRTAGFQVAIRTLHLNRRTGMAEYGTGGGIVWDSGAASEYEESLTKALVLTSPLPEFSLLETLRWEPGPGYWLLEEHLRRLQDSAGYFDIPLQATRLISRLDGAAARFDAGPQRVRLQVNRRGEITITSTPLTPPGGDADRPWRVALAATPIDSRDRFLFHKTTHRTLYENRIPHFAKCGTTLDDVILWNERGEITESTIANVVARFGDERVTPPVSCGLLPGVFRARLLADGVIREGVIPRDRLRHADAIHLINSVRGWVRAELRDG